MGLGIMLEVSFHLRIRQGSEIICLRPDHKEGTCDDGPVFQTAVALQPDELALIVADDEGVVLVGIDTLNGASSDSLLQGFQIVPDLPDTGRLSRLHINNTVGIR